MFKRAGNKKQYLIGDLKLDPQTSQLWRDNDEIVLPKLSFQLLKVLAENAPNLLSQEELIGEIWPEMVVGDETLKQRVRLLRKALGDSAKSPQYLGAVRGQGYRLLPEVKILWLQQVPAIEFDLASSDRVPNLMYAGTQKLWQRISMLLAGIIVLLMTTLFLLSQKLSVQADHRPLKNLAILPFVNVTQNPEDQYLASGMTDELIRMMSEIGSLLVTPKSEVAKYRNNQRQIKEIASALKVGSILDGALYRQGDQLSFQFKLVESNQSQILWQAKFDFASNDILAIQREVILGVAEHLKANLEPNKALKTLVLTQPNQTVKAYDYYLKGRDYYNRYRQTDNLNAIKFYQQALKLDDKFALAHAGLADAYSQGVFQFGAPDAWKKLALASAQNAIALDNSKAESHKALGLAFYLNGQLEKAIESNLRAVKISPRHAQAITNLAYLYRQKAQLNEAKKWHQRAIELAPDYAPAWIHYAQTLLATKNYQSAEKYFLKALQLKPDYAFATTLYARFLMLNERSDEALNILKQALQRSPLEYEYLFSAGKINLYLGHYQQALSYFKQAYDNHLFDCPNDSVLENANCPQPEENVFSVNRELALLISICEVMLGKASENLAIQSQLWQNKVVAMSDNPQDHFLLAMALAAQKKYLNANDALKKARQLGLIESQLTSQIVLLQPAIE